MSLKSKIDYFVSNSPESCQSTLKEIILCMLNVIKYNNGDTLERHNWGKAPVKLINLPSSKSDNYETELLKCLDGDQTDSAIIELLWGDVQLGKRVHACIIMWFSIYILERPVFYIFRNLTIDKEQLLNDINKAGYNTFNGTFIRSMFEKNVSKILKIDPKVKISNVWKKYILPGMRDNTRFTKDTIKATDMMCCLMNYKQLERLNDNFTEYIAENGELVNFTMLVDESDLAAPTSSNDKSNIKDLEDTTHCERLLSKTYKKVKYVLQITGTAQSILWNITTRISEHHVIQVMPSKIHKMRRTSDYYGLFSICDVAGYDPQINNSDDEPDGDEPEEGAAPKPAKNSKPLEKINIDTDMIVEWWSKKEEGSKKLPAYKITVDYEKNIKKLITHICSRKNVKYNSLLISEEKTRSKQFNLVVAILDDFPDLFVIIYHGNILRLYAPEKYSDDLIKISNETHGILTKLVKDKHHHFDIRADGANIKMIYKMLRMLFETCKGSSKTVITITGKYGERGYSFVSDDYKEYSFHLTDQYLVSHSVINCTDISQRVRLQGKYNTPELLSGKMKLTLWTTKKVKTIIDFYIKFMYSIEKVCMQCKNYKDILEMVAVAIDECDSAGKYFKFLDAKKKLKNFVKEDEYDAKAKGFKVSELGNNECINDLITVDIDTFTDRYGKWTYKTDCVEHEFDAFAEYESFITANDIMRTRLTKDETGNFYKCSVSRGVKVYQYDSLKLELPTLSASFGIKNIDAGTRIGATLSRLYVGYRNLLDHMSGVFILRLCKILDKKFVLPPNSTNYTKKRPYLVKGKTVIYSELKSKFVGNLPNIYYWKNLNGNIYKCDPAADRKSATVNIREINDNDVVAASSTKTVNHQLGVESVEHFNTSCCKKSQNPFIRIGIKDLFAEYKKWCDLNKATNLPMAKFKAKFESLGHMELKSKGFSIDAKPKSRGYNIVVNL